MQMVVCLSLYSMFVCQVYLEVLCLMVLSDVDASLLEWIRDFQHEVPCMTSAARVRPPEINVGWLSICTAYLVNGLCFALLLFVCIVLGYCADQDCTRIVGL